MLTQRYTPDFFLFSSRICILLRSALEYIATGYTGDELTTVLLLESETFLYARATEDVENLTDLVKCRNNVFLALFYIYFFLYFNFGSYFFQLIQRVRGLAFRGPSTFLRVPAFKLIRVFTSYNISAIIQHINLKVIKYKY